MKYNAFKSQQSGRNSILLPLKNEPLLMLILNNLPLALGYLLKCYKFHKQGFGEAWDKGLHEAIALLKEASKKNEQTIIMITHNRSIAQTADRVLQVSDGNLTDFARCRE